MPLGQTGDSMNWVGAIFRCLWRRNRRQGRQHYGQVGRTKQMLEFFKRLVPLLPDGVFAWDDSSNNKALISGQSALIMNPPSAWAVAVRDAPKVAEQCWHFPSPKGPKGRFDPAQPSYWGIWNFSPNKSAGKSLLAAPVGEGFWSNSSLPAARAMISRHSEPCATSRPGPRKARQRAASGIIRRAAMSSRLVSGLAGADADRQPDFCSSDDDQDDRPIHAAGEDDGAGDGLGSG